MSAVLTTLWIHSIPESNLAYIPGMVDPQPIPKEVTPEN